MPVKVRGDDGQVYDMPWAGANLPTDDDVDIWLKHNAGKTESPGIMSTIASIPDKYRAFKREHPIAQKAEDVMFGTPTVADPRDSTKRLPVNAPSLPAIGSGPINGTAGIVRALNSPTAQRIFSGGQVLESGRNLKNDYDKGDYYGMAKDAGFGVLGLLGLKYAGMHQPEAPQVQKPRLALPPAPPEIANAPPKPRFIAGSEGVALNNDYPLPHGNTAPPDLIANGGVSDFAPPAQNRGSAADLNALSEQRRLSNVSMTPETWAARAAGRGSLEIPDQPNMPIPAVSGDRHLGFNEQSGANLNYPENVVPNSVRPRTVQSNMGRTVPNRFTEPLSEPGEPITFSSPEPGPITDVPPASNEYQLPTAGRVSRQEKINSLPKNETQFNSSEPDVRGPDLQTIANDPREMRERNGFPLGNTPVSVKDSTAGVRENPIRRLLNNQKGELKLWRGMVGKADDPRAPREGYAVFSTNNKHLAGSYAENDPIPLTLKDKGVKVIEFPVTKSKYGTGNDFDKFEFDRRARSLGPDEVLVAKNVYDIGPRNNSIKDPNKLATYPSDVYATTNPELMDVGHKSGMLDRLIKNEKGELIISKGNSKSNTTVPPSSDTGNSDGRPPNTNSTISNDLTYRPIPKETPVDDAVKQWAYGRNAAKFRGGLAKDSFSDLTDKSLVDKYEAGDRTGRLADVQKRLDQLHALGVKAGIFGEDQKVPNYLRHEFDNSEEEITAAVNQYVAKNPSIAKTRQFPTYAEAEASGLKRKFDTVPELMDAYESKLTTAVRNKEFYDYLKSTGKLAKGSFSTKPTDWTFKGPDADRLKTLVGNYFSEDKTSPVSDAVSTTKNLYLGGGVPGTKYNMHAYNIARSDAKLAGFGRATIELLTDPTGNKAVETYNSLKHMVPDLVEHGYTTQPIEDVSHGRNWDANKATKLAGKGLDKLEQTFEDPLFKRALPALKLKRTVEVFQKLEPTLGREQALTEAAKIGNEFYGGINKSLRDKTRVGLSRIIFLAPDWLESRMLLAKRDYTGLAKTLVGNGNAVDSIGAKSAARGLALGAGTIGASYLSSGKLPSIKTKPGDVLTVPAGKSGKKTREIDTFGTSDEGVRVPIESALKAFQGNPAGLIDMMITNRLSLPLKATKNVLFGEDDFGNPIRGKDKYGKKISEGKAVVNYLKELSRPAQLQAIQGMLKYANGDASLEEALSTAAELPIKYSGKPHNGRASSGISMGGLRMPH